MEENRLPRQSELFIVRLWPEALGDGQIEWRGRVQHALSNRASYFREWPALLAYFTDFLAAEQAEINPTGETKVADKQITKMG